MFCFVGRRFAGSNCLTLLVAVLNRRADVIDKLGSKYTSYSVAHHLVREIYGCVLDGIRFRRYSTLRLWQR